MLSTRREVLRTALAFWPLARLAATRPPAGADRAGEIEWHIAFLTNQQRVWHQLAPLESADDLAAVARGHSRDMLARNYFDHRTPEGIGPHERIGRQGLRYELSSENLFKMKDGTADAAELASIMVAGWMDTKGHRRNILDPALRYLGVGVAISQRVVIATQLFGG